MSAGRKWVGLLKPDGDWGRFLSTHFSTAEFTDVTVRAHLSRKFLLPIFKLTWLVFKLKIFFLKTLYLTSDHQNGFLCSSVCLMAKQYSK